MSKKKDKADWEIASENDCAQAIDLNSGTAVASFEFKDNNPFFNAYLKNQKTHSVCISADGRILSGELEGYNLNVGSAIQVAGTSVLFGSQKENELSRDISRLQSEVFELTEKSEKTAEDLEAAKQKISELQRQMQVKDLVDRVRKEAKEKILHDEEFSKELLKEELRESFVLSIDIRRSTELMLNAIEPQYFAELMIKLESALSDIIKLNNGIFEKFTGDGILAFFPKFFTGNDAGYYCLRAAIQSHKAFNVIYEKYRSQFKITLLETGLGIGIDFGQIWISTVTTSMNIIGDPVVYACRMSGAPAGKTYINNRAFHELERIYRGHIKTKEAVINITNVGNCMANCLEHFDEVDKISKPVWLGKSQDVKSSQKEKM